MAQQHVSQARGARFSWGTAGRSLSRTRGRRRFRVEDLEPRCLLAAATQLVVATQPPASVVVNSGFKVVIDAEDGTGAVDSTYNGVVTLALQNNPGSATLGGSISVTAANGVATFPGVTINEIANGYTIQATGTASSAGSLTAATTNAIDVTPLPATQLVVTTPPSGVTDGNAFTVVVSAENGQGQVDPNFNGNVTVALGTNPGGATLGGTLTEPAVNGVATFSDLTLNQIAKGYTLQFTTTGLTGVATSLFNVSPAPATQLVVTTEPPSNVVAGNPFGLTVYAENPENQIDTNYNGPVTVAFAAGGNPNGATLYGTLTVNAVQGVAAFSNLAIDQGGTGYVLSVTSGSLTAATTSSITSTVQPATQLVVTTEPPRSVPEGTPFGLVVSAESAQGYVDPTVPGTVTLTLLNPGTATLGGTLKAPLTNGVATFSGLTLDTVGPNFTIQASVDGLTSASTTPINVTTAAATQLVVTTPPPAEVGVGSTFGLVVSAENGLGQVDPNFTGVVTIALTGGPAGAQLAGLLTANAVAGVATFGGLTISPAGAGYTIQATATGLSSVTTTFTGTDTAQVPSTPQLSPASDTGVSNSDGITMDNGTTSAPLTFTVGGVVPGNGYVQLYSINNPTDPIALGGLVQAVNGTATITIAGNVPLTDGTYDIAATAVANNTTDTPSAMSTSTSITVQTSLQVVSVTPTGDYLTSLPKNQIVVTFNHWLAGLVPDLADGSGFASNPFAVALIPSGPDGGAQAAAGQSLWTAPAGYDSGDVAMPATLVYHENANGTSTITLTPNQPLTTDVYLVSIDGLNDLAGNALTSATGSPQPVYDSFTFQATPTDTTPLGVTSVTTDNGTVAIDNNLISQPDTIAIAFNKALDPWSVNTSSIQLLVKTSSGAYLPLPAAVTYSPNTQTAYLTPETILTPGTLYVVSVGTSVTDDQAFPLLGTGLPGFYYTSFEVSDTGVNGQVSPLTVTSVSPPDGTMWTTPFGYASIGFSERLTLSALGRYSVMLIPQTGGVTTGRSGYADVPVNAKLAFNPNTDQLIIVPTGLLANDTVYLIALTGVTASNGDGLTIPGGGTTYYSSFLLNTAPTGVTALSAVASPSVAGNPTGIDPAAHPAVKPSTSSAPAGRPHHHARPAQAGPGDAVDRVLDGSFVLVRRKHH